MWETGVAPITVLAVTLAYAEKLFALVAVELEIDSVRIEIHGIGAVRAVPEGIRIGLPTVPASG